MRLIRLSFFAYFFLFAFISCKKSKDKTPSSLKEGLIAYYPFTGNANNQASNTLHGNVIGAQLTTDRNGAANRAYAFSANQMIEIPGSESQNTYPLSISLWVKIDNAAGGNIFSKYNSGMWNGFQLSVTTSSAYGNHIYPYYLNGGVIPNGIIGNYGLSNSFIWQNISLNVWNHYVFTVSETGGKLFKNGDLIEQIGWRTTPGPSSNTLHWIIGGQSDRNNIVSQPWFQGKIDEIRIFNRSLTQAEITYLATH